MKTLEELKAGRPGLRKFRNLDVGNLEYYDMGAYRSAILKWADTLLQAVADRESHAKGYRAGWIKEQAKLKLFEQERDEAVKKEADLVELGLNAAGRIVKLEKECDDYKAAFIELWEYINAYVEDVGVGNPTTVCEKDVAILEKHRQLIKGE